MSYWGIKCYDEYDMLEMSVSYLGIKCYAGYDMLEI